MRGNGHPCGQISGGSWAARRGWRRHFEPGHEFGGRHGRGGDMKRAGRMLAHGDLRLIALALIAEQPRHGYEIIKLLEDRTGGWYSPSPGVVYPTLTFLEEVGYVTAQAEGAKKLYAITEQGSDHLADNRDLAEAVLERLAAIGARATRMRRHAGEDDDRPAVPRLVQAAIENLREIASMRIDADAEAEVKVVEVLARAAAELKKV